MGNNMACDSVCCGVQDKNSLNLEASGNDPKGNTGKIRHHPNGSGRKNGTA
jgi:hypothetical protein